MSIRINNAKNFKGKAYVAADELDTLIKSLKLSDNKLTFTTADGGAVDTQATDLSGLVTLVHNGTLLTVSNNQIDATGLTTFVGTAQANKVVMTDGSKNLAYEKDVVTSITADSANIPTEGAVKAYVDSKAVVVTAGNGIAIDNSTPTSPKISANIKIVAAPTAEGYAASYDLMLRNPDVAEEGAAGAWVKAGESINIVKDQFLKTGSLVYGTSAILNELGAVDGESTTKSETAKYPFIKLVLNVNTNGNAADDEGTVATIYIPVNDLFRDKTAGNGIDSTELANNKIQVKVDDATSGKVYATKGLESAVLTVGEGGIKVANIQEAIDLAVNDEHTKMGAYVGSVADNTQAAITAVENAVETYTQNVVQVVEEVVTPTKVDTTTTEYSCQVTARNIIGVFGADGLQIYPEIKKESGTFTLTADYGTETADAQWTVVCTKALPALEKTTIAPSTLDDLNYQQK